MTATFTDEQRLALIEEALATDHTPTTKLALVRIALETGADAPPPMNERPPITASDIKRIVTNFAGEPKAAKRARPKRDAKPKKAEKTTRPQAGHGQTASKLLALLADGQRHTTQELAEAIGMDPGNVTGSLGYQRKKGTVLRPAPSTWQLA